MGLICLSHSDGLCAVAVDSGLVDLGGGIRADSVSVIPSDCRLNHDVVPWLGGVYGRCLDDGLRLLTFGLVGTVSRSSHASLVNGGDNPAMGHGGSSRSCNRCFIRDCRGSIHRDIVRRCGIRSGTGISAGFESEHTVGIGRVVGRPLAMRRLINDAFLATALLAAKARTPIVL